MAWWFWILLWVALLALSLLLFGVLGLRLFRSAMSTLHELEEAGDKLGRLEDRAVPADNEAAAVNHKGLVTPAVFRDPHEVRNEYLSGKLDRKELRRQRRLQRKRDRKQPRSLRDLTSI